MNEDYSTQDGFDIWRFLVGVLYLVGAYLAYTNTVATLYLVSVFFAATTLVRGIQLLVARRRIKRVFGNYPHFLLFNGIVNLLLGIFLIIRPDVSLATLSYLFIFWFLMDAIRTLWTARIYRRFSAGRYWLRIISSIVGIVLAIFLLANPIIATFAISTLITIYFAWFGIMEIVLAF